MLKIINVVGARPNFMKVAPIVAAMKRRQREFAPFRGFAVQIELAEDAARTLVGIGNAGLARL